MSLPWSEIGTVAEREARMSGLPGLNGGPADALRHIIATAELRRRFGAVAAFVVADGNETRGQIAGHARASTLMDRTNNAIGMEIGATARTFEDVVRAARAAIAAGTRVNGSNSDGSPMWLKPAQWAEATPRTAVVIAAELQAMDAWQPSTAPISTYPAGGFDRRFVPGVSMRRDMEREYLAVLAEVPPEKWSEDDARAVIRSSTYTDSRSPERQVWQTRVAAYFTAKVEREAAQDTTALPTVEPGTCAATVTVRGYRRAGRNGPIEVSGHQRGNSCAAP